MADYMGNLEQRPTAAEIMENGKWKMENERISFLIFHFPFSIFRFFGFAEKFEPQKTDCSGRQRSQQNRHFRGVNNIRIRRQKPDS